MYYTAAVSKETRRSRDFMMAYILSPSRSISLPLSLSFSVRRNSVSSPLSDTLGIREMPFAIFKMPQLQLKKEPI